MADLAGLTRPEEAAREIADRFAPDGKIWVCRACGKSAKDRYGIDGAHSYGWDESCAMNAVLHDAPPPEGSG